MKNKLWDYLTSWVEILGLCIVGIGVGVMCGYLSGFVRLYRWVGGEGMAFNSALAHIISGITLFLCGIILKHNAKNTGQV